MDRVECVIAGAGIVGLAIGKVLADCGIEVLVLEQAAAIGTGVSARSSEVVHAGIYYPPASLKARLCIRGKALLYHYCAERGVPCRRIGKFIVGTSPAQLETLRGLQANAAACGLMALRWVEAAEIRAIEPALRCEAGLYSETSGIIDSHALMLACLGDIERSGGALAVHAPVRAVERDAAGYVVTTGGDDGMQIGCRYFINAAGLGAVALAQGISGYPKARIPQAYLAKGNYFGLQGVRAPFQHLIYPVPEPGGLGIHATIDMGGQIRFGPDVQWIETADYTVDQARLDVFESAIRAYWPALPEGSLAAAYAGIRPKISAPGAPAADFRIDRPEDHGLPGLVSLFGIESPGLTASLALAEQVRDALITTGG